MLKIDLYCNDGSPLTLIPADIEGRGVGGAELAMMTWAEVMGSRGHEVRIYNNPSERGNHGHVTYLQQREFNPSDIRDAFIIFRSPNPHITTANAAIKIHWSCDQETSGDYGRDIVPNVDRIVCISPYHEDYYKERYGASADRIGYFDLGVRVSDYQSDIEKVPGRCIYCSVPDRGLEFLQVMWEELKTRQPNLSLIITADYRLWGAPAPRDHKHRLDWLGQRSVIYAGKIGRTKPSEDNPLILIEEQLKAEFQLFPCSYEELFCISSAECQVAGAIPITSNQGALRTTNEFGIILDGHPKDAYWRNDYIEVADAAISNPINRETMKAGAAKRFDWEKICAQWEHLMQTGEYETREKELVAI